MSGLQNTFETPCEPLGKGLATPSRFQVAEGCANLERTPLFDELDTYRIAPGSWFRTSCPYSLALRASIRTSPHQRLPGGRRRSTRRPSPLPVVVHGTFTIHCVFVWLPRIRGGGRFCCFPSPERKSMITLKSLSQKRCIFCESHETANVRVRGEREFSGAVCRAHVWQLLEQDQTRSSDQKPSPTGR